MAMSEFLDPHSLPMLTLTRPPRTVTFDTPVAYQTAKNLHLNAPIVHEANGQAYANRREGPEPLQ